MSSKRSTSLPLSLDTLDILQEVVRRLGALQAPDRLYSEAVREAADLFNATRCALLLYDRVSGDIRICPDAIGLEQVQAQALSEYAKRHLHQFLNNWPEHGVVRLPAPEHQLSDSAYVELIAREALCSLIRADGQIIGALWLGDKRWAATFSQEELHLFGLYASQLGVLIQGLQLLAQEHQARLLAETLMMVPQVAHQAVPRADGGASAEAVLGSNQLRPLLTRLLELLNKVTDFSSATVTLLDGQRLTIIASYGSASITKLVGYAWDATHDRKFQAIISSGRPLSIPDTHSDQRWLAVQGSETIRAWIGAPIWAPGTSRHSYSDLIGVLNVDSDQPGFFSDADVAVAQAFADQMAIVLENQRLYTGMARRIAELAALQETSVAVTAHHDLESLLAILVERATALLHGESGMVSLLDEATGQLRIASEFNVYPSVRGKTTRLGEGVAGIVAQTGEPVLIPDYEAQPNRALLFADHVIGALAEVPLRWKGKPLGVLAVFSGRSGRTFAQEDLSLLSLFADQAAAALSSARLFDETQRHLQRAEQRRRELALINRISESISAILNPDELLSQVVELLSERFGYYHVHIFLIDEGGKYLVARAGSGVVGRQLVADKYRLEIASRGLCSLAVNTAQTILVRDVSKDPRYQNCEQLSATRSEIAVPMKLGGRVVGVLDVQSDRVRAFVEADQFMLETLADQVAIALENARLYRDLAERAGELAAANDELKALDRMKDEFVQTVSHELRTPLTFIRGYVELLLDGTMGDLTQEQRNSLHIVSERTGNIINLVNDIISLTRAESIELVLGRIDLAKIAQSSVESARAVTAPAGIHLEAEIVPDLPPVQGDPQRLSQVFDNLIGNAIKFSPNGGRVLVRLDANDSHVRGEVTDEGIGIPSDQLERIWDRFYQVDSTTTRQFGGTGLGLAIVKQLVEAHGGHVGVCSVVGGGSTFRFTVPRADTRADTRADQPAGDRKRT